MEACFGSVDVVDIATFSRTIDVCFFLGCAGVCVGRDIPCLRRVLRGVLVLGVTVASC